MTQLGVAAKVYGFLGKTGTVYQGAYGVSGGRRVVFGGDFCCKASLLLLVLLLLQAPLWHDFIALIILLKGVLRVMRRRLKDFQRDFKRSLKSN